LSRAIQLRALKRARDIIFTEEGKEDDQSDPNRVTLLIVQPAIDQSTNPPVEGRGHRVVEEQVSTSTIDLEEDSSVAAYSTAWPSTMETDIMDNEILMGTMDYKSSLEVTTAASTNEVSILRITYNGNRYLRGFEIPARASARTLGKSFSCKSRGNYC